MAEKAQAGDLIRVVSPVVNISGGNGDYKVGDIYEVKGRNDGDTGVHLTVDWPGYPGISMFLFDREYVIHRKAGEEDTEGTPCDDFIVDGCLFETHDGLVRRAVDVTDEWVYADDGERYKRMFVNRVTDVMTTKGYELMEESKVIFAKSAEKAEETQDNAVDHPSHYTQGRFETIEIIEEVTQGYSDGYVAYCIGNALKYLARAPFKHESPEEDLAKARAYLDFAIKRLGDAT